MRGGYEREAKAHHIPGAVIVYIRHLLQHRANGWLVHCQTRGQVCGRNRLTGCELANEGDADMLMRTTQAVGYRCDQIGKLRLVHTSSSPSTLLWLDQRRQLVAQLRAGIDNRPIEVDQ